MEKILVCTYDKNLTPEKKTLEAVCWDLKISENLEIEAGGLKIISTGIKTYLPFGWQAKIFARSSLPVKFGLMLANSTAVIDSDYRGEYFIQLYNFTKETLKFEKYSRLTQMEFLPYYIGSGNFGTEYIPEIEFITDKKLYDNFEKKFSSIRSAGGFGSTGK